MVQLVIDQAAVHGSLVVPCGLVVHQTHILKEDALHKGRTALGEGCFIMQISVQKTNCRTDFAAEASSEQLIINFYTGLIEHKVAVLKKIVQVPVGLFICF